MNRALPKNAIFAKFAPNASDKQRFDTDIKRLTIVHEISAPTVNIAAGETVSAVFVVLVNLRNFDCDPKNIYFLSKFIPQNMLFVLEHEGKARLATFRTKVIQTEWKPIEEWELKLTGLNLDRVWENIIVQIGGLQIRNSEFGVRNYHNEYIYFDNVDDALAADISSPASSGSILG